MLAPFDEMHRIDGDIWRIDQVGKLGHMLKQQHQTIRLAIRQRAKQCAVDQGKHSRDAADRQRHNTDNGNAIPR